MARCKNCGWDNPDNATKCEKCGSPLAAQAPREETSYANKTVMENSVFGDSNDTSMDRPSAYIGTQPGSTANVCPKCGYPMRPGVSECPQCGYSSNTIPEKIIIEPEEPRGHNHISPAGGGKDFHGTAPIWGATGGDNKNVFITCQCTLSPVPIPGVATPNDLVVEDDCVELNRQNLDPKNTSISREIQAMLTFENGQWYIQDKSNQHTTFVYAGDKIPLKDGDKILMGGVRIFEFKEN